MIKEEIGSVKEDEMIMIVIVGITTMTTEVIITQMTVVMEETMRIMIEITEMIEIMMTVTEMIEIIIRMHQG